MPWFDFRTAIEGLAEEKPWAPRQIVMIDGDRYEGPHQFDGSELDPDPQDIHAGDEADDLDTLSELGITVKR